MEMVEVVSGHIEKVGHENGIIEVHYKGGAKYRGECSAEKHAGIMKPGGSVGKSLAASGIRLVKIEPEIAPVTVTVQAIVPFLSAIIEKRPDILGLIVDIKTPALEAFVSKNGLSSFPGLFIAKADGTSAPQ